jgi:GH25 family lysozyme M1 (1,4-beta-N-acetylmuramidase)
MSSLPRYGVDVSEHQSAIDWEKVKAAGKSFAMVRAGYGKTEDKMFVSHFVGAVRAGLHAGVYWFCYAENASDAKEETAACLKTIAPFRKSIDMPVAYDFEADTLSNAAKQGVTITKATGTAICKTFADAVAEAGYIPAIYTGQVYTSSYIDMTQFKAELWNAAWASYDPPIKSNAHRWPMWQYTVLQPTGSLFPGYTRGSVDGISGNVDLNVCYVDYPALYAEKDVPRPAAKYITLAKLKELGYDGVIIPTK